MKSQSTKVVRKKPQRTVPRQQSANKPARLRVAKKQTYMDERAPHTRYAG